MNIIADSSALVSLVSEDDSNHKLAIKIVAEIDGSIVIPSEIITEFINVLGKKAGHKEASKKAKIIFDSQSFEIIETTSKIRLNAFEKFQKQPESVSFTDCIVMAFGDEFETREIFGFDKGFKKNGYKRIGIDPD